MNLEMIGYLLYSGLGMLILAFLFLAASMVQKIEKIRDIPYDDNEDEYSYEEEEEEEEKVSSTPKRNFKLNFGFGKKKKNSSLEEKYEEENSYDEDKYDYEESGYKDKPVYQKDEEEKEFFPNKPDDYNYQDDGVEDEYESDFAFIESVSKQAQNTYSNFNFSNYEDEKKEKYGIEEDFLTDDLDDENFLTDDLDDSDFLVNSLETEKEDANKSKGLLIKKYEDEYEEDLEVEKEMLERIKAYKDRFKK